MIVKGQAAERVQPGGAVPAGVGRWVSAHHGTPTMVRVKDAAGRLLAVGNMSAGAAGSDAVPGIAIDKVLVDVNTVNR